MEEKTNPNKHEIKRDDKGRFLKGFAPNPKGRPVGPTLKEWARKKLMEMSEEERNEFLKGLPKEVIWKMSEGNPKEQVEVETVTNPYGELTDEQLKDRLEGRLGRMGQKVGEEGPNIPDGGHIGLPKDGTDTPEGGEVPEEDSPRVKESSDTITEVSPENNTDNNKLDDPAVNQQPEPKNTDN